MANLLEITGRETLSQLDYVGSLNIQWWATLRGMRAALPLVGNREVAFYEYHRWASDPRTLVTSAVIEHLRAGGQFTMVSMYDGRPNNDYVFSGRLEKLEEVDYESGVKVEVAVSAQIIKVATGATVWSNAVSEIRPVSQRNVSGVVSEMNRTVDFAINNLLSTVPASLGSER
jgi:ABC-type uncharacterized transport system auxiliary subunit